MRETSCAQRVLALFTSPECAEAIAGDFAEARGDRSAAWFWWQVLTTATALVGRAIATAPLASVGVAALGVLQFGSLAFAGFALLVSRLVGLDGRDLHIPNVVFWSITTFTAVPLLAGAMAARSRVASAATAAPAR